MGTPRRAFAFGFSFAGESAQLTETKHNKVNKKNDNMYICKLDSSHRGRVCFQQTNIGIAHLSLSLNSYLHIANIGVILAQLCLYAKWPWEPDGWFAISPKEPKYVLFLVVSSHSLHRNSAFGAKKHTSRPYSFFGI